MAKKQSGGMNIRDSKVRIGGDAVGRDKFEEHTYYDAVAQDEKSGFLLFIERSVAFIFALLIAGFIFGGIGTLIGSAMDAAEMGAFLGAVLALGVAISAASNVSRFR